MKSIPKPGDSGKWERVRRLRYGHVLKLIRFRYGAKGVPPDDAGRPDLMELIWLASSAPAGADKKVRNCIELYAPWMDEEEKRDLLELVAMTPTYEKAKTSQELGNEILLSNADRERLKLYSIRPCDLTPEEFEKQSKERKKASRASQRRRDGVRTREEYLSECRNKPRPWLAEGISRSKWERRRRKVATDMTQGQGPRILCKQLPDLASPKRVESQQEGLQGSGATGRPVVVGESEQAESKEQRRSHAVSPHLEAPADDERLIALNNWGKNAEEKIRNRKSLGPNRCSAKSCVISRSFHQRQMNSLSRRHHEQRDRVSRRSLRPRGRWCYGGRGFKTAEDLRANLSPLELKLLATWAYYRFGPNRTSVTALLEGSAA